MMRIAYICADPGIPVFGCKGCSLHVQEIIRSLQNLSMEVTLFAANRGGEAPADLQQVSVITLPPRSNTAGKADRAQREQYAIQSHHWFMWKLFQEQPFDLIYERYSLWSRVGVDYATLQHIPAILEVNAPLIEEAKNYRGLINENQALSIAQYNVRHASLIGCVSQAVADYVRTLAGDLQKKKIPILVTPNAVNPQRFTAFLSNTASNTALHKNQRLVTDPLTIGFVGTLKPWHGLENLLKAFASFCQQRPALQSSLLIVGDGPQREAMEILAKNLHIKDKLHFTGAVVPAEVPQWLSKMDMAVAPYPKLKNFYFSPLKVFEYMAAGLPVIASNIGQIKELFQQKEHAVLVKPGSVSALSDALYQLSLDPQRATAMAQQAQQHILQHYTWDAVAENLLKQLSAQQNQPAPLRYSVSGVAS